MKTLDQGEFSSGARFELIKSDLLPEGATVTAVMGIIMDDDQNVFLTKNHRGWDLPGGHVEKGETLDQALRREVSEEAGTNIAQDTALWGYTKLQSDEPIADGRGGYYPTESYISYYQGKNIGETFPPHGEEVIEALKLPITAALLKVQHRSDKIVLQDIAESKY